MASLWHPNAKRVPIPTAPQGLTFAGGGKKLVWHTTEGSSAEGAVQAYKNAGVCPHFTIGLKDDKRVLLQHLPIDRAASALAHPSGPHTNRANAIQVEVVGFANKSGDWPQHLYHYLHLLAVWCQKHKGIPLTTSVLWRHPERLSGSQFYAYEGHCGHVHVPGNDHYDPGRGFHVGKVLKGVSK